RDLRILRLDLEELRVDEHVTDARRRRTDLLLDRDDGAAGRAGLAQEVDRCVVEAAPAAGAGRRRLHAARAERERCDEERSERGTPLHQIAVQPPSTGNTTPVT